MKIGFIGLGQMGLPMAENIVDKGFQLTVYNRTKQKAESLLKKGAEWAATPCELATQCDVVITMVTDDTVLKETTLGKDGILHSAKKGLIHISMSTVSPTLIQSMQKDHALKGCSLVSAPVSGRPERAKAGMLWIFLAGEPKIKGMVKPVLQTMSCTIYDLGDYAEQANVFKLCNNFMILAHIEQMAEALAMLEKNGVPMEKGIEVWGSSFFDSIIFHLYGEILCKQKFTPGGFTLDLGLKDMDLLQTCVDRDQMSMPILAILREKLSTSMTMGREKYDWSAIALLTREMAGLKDKSSTDSKK